MKFGEPNRNKDSMTGKNREGDKNEIKHWIDKVLIPERADYINYLLCSLCVNSH